MIVLFLLALTVSAGLTIDAQPTTKKEIEIVYKQAIQYTDEMRAKEDEEQLAHKVNKFIDVGPSILKRCNIHRCEINDLEEVL